MGFEPTNTRATASRSSCRASATPQRLNLLRHQRTYVATAKEPGAPRRRRADLRSLQGSARCARRAGPSHLEPSARIERATSALPMRRSASRTSTAQSTGADDRARTNTFSLTRRAHCLSCSIRTSGGPNRIRTGDFLRDRQARTARLLYESVKTECPSTRICQAFGLPIPRSGHSS